MWIGFVETYRGDTLCIVDTEGDNVGKPLLALLPILSNYCTGFEASDEEKSFLDLSSIINKDSFCSHTKSLLETFYVGDWDYSEDEYQIFLLRNPNMQLSEEDFARALRQVQSKWLPIKNVKRSVEYLVKLFKDNSLPPNSWYSEKDTLPALQALLNTIELLEVRGSDRIRIKFI